jgi:hypothetical protein
MVAALKILRSLTFGNRPSGKTYGEPYVNLAENQFGVVDSGNTPRDLLGVPIFSSGATYAAGKAVNYQDGIYVALVTVAAGAFNSTQWSRIATLSDITNTINAQNPSCGRFEYVSATQARFSPYMGSKFKINGIIYDIPGTGISANNTGCFVNGVGGSNLAPNAFYYATVFNNAGTPTIDFRTIGDMPNHVRSGTAGNVGVEVRWSGSAEDPSRSLVGMIYTNASSQFVDSSITRSVISWFNRRNRHLLGSAAGPLTFATTSATEISTAHRVSFLNWGDEGVTLGLIGYGYNDTAGQAVFLQIAVDGTNLWNPFPYIQFPVANTIASLSSAQPAGDVAPFNVETLHTSSILGGVTGGNGTVNIRQSGMIRG